MPEEIQENKLFVGNLPWSVADDQLKDLFAAVEGVEVVEAKVISDKMTGRSRGFGFVTLVNAEMAKIAIEALNNKEVDGRTIFVNVSRPMKRDEDRGGRSSGGYGRNSR